jgi:hypothetical protein
LMDPAIGIYRLISERIRPITIKMSNIWIRGMIYSPLDVGKYARDSTGSFFI